MKLHARAATTIRRAATTVVVATVLLVAFVQVPHGTNRLELVADWGFLAIVTTALLGALAIRSHTRHADRHEDTRT